jgi:hypothetical protein
MYLCYVFVFGVNSVLFVVAGISRIENEILKSNFVGNQHINLHPTHQEIV